MREFCRSSVDLFAAFTGSDTSRYPIVPTTFGPENTDAEDGVDVGIVVGFGPPLMPSGDIEADINTLQAFYAPYARTGKKPGQY